MKIDWCKDTGRWNVWDIHTGALLAKTDSVRIESATDFITTDGGRHGYAIAAGTLEIVNGTAIIRRRDNGEG